MSFVWLKGVWVFRGRFAHNGLVRGVGHRLVGFLDYHELAFGARQPPDE